MRSKASLFYVLTLVALLALAACGPAPSAAVTFNSHSDGATIYGERTITLTADLAQAAPGASISVATDALSYSEERVGDLLELEVKLKDNSNTITVSVANPGQAVPASATIELHYPFITLGMEQAARTVIGQPDFDTIDESAPEKKFEGPYGKPTVVGEVLYLPDYSLDRVMGYRQVPAVNDAAADFVLGKQDFADTDSTIGPATFSGPQTVEYDGERLYVLDYSWSRILVFEGAPTTSGAAAMHVIGQKDFTTSEVLTTSTRFTYPEGFTIAGGRLIVADADNNRVLIWNTVPTAVDTPANVVLGQLDMNSGSANGGGSVGRSGMDYPSDVWSDGTRLVVVDQDNNRILIWNSFPTSNNAPADVVLGQADFASSGSGQTASGMYNPYSVHSNGNQLFVADASNNRVLVWNSFPAVNGQPADVVLGQPDVDDSTSRTSATGMHYPTSVYAHGNSLIVGDNDNGRYLVFEGAAL